MNVTDGNDHSSSTLSVHAVPPVDVQGILALVSHDLRAPARHINGFLTELLAEIPSEHITPAGEAYIAQLLRAAETIVNKLAALDSYANLMNRPHDPVECDTAIVVSEALAAVPDPWRDRVQLIASGLPTVRADRGALTEAFTELLTNASKFGHPETQITIEVRSSGTEWEVLVSDDGKGIAPARAGNVFELFRRCHGASIPGNGTGLAEVKKVIERHGGTVDFQSMPDQGSTVSFTLPM